MLPLSLGRTHPVPARQHWAHPLAWLRPVNVAAIRHTELRALFAWLSAFVACAVFIALGHVWLRIQVVDVAYRLSTTREAIDKLREEQRELTAQVASLNANDRLAEIARSRLGMMRPDKGCEAMLP
jgi:cell division protein FtsL